MKKIFPFIVVGLFYLLSVAYALSPPGHTEMCPLPSAIKFDSNTTSKHHIQHWQKSYRVIPPTGWEVKTSDSNDAAVGEINWPKVLVLGPSVKLDHVYADVTKNNVNYNYHIIVATVHCNYTTTTDLLTRWQIFSLYKESEIDLDHSMDGLWYHYDSSGSEGFACYDYDRGITASSCKWMAPANATTL